MWEFHRRAEERGVDPKKRRAPHDRADVVGVSHALEGDGRATRPDQHVRELVRPEPFPPSRAQAEPLVVLRARDGLELVVPDLEARHPARRGPAGEPFDLAAHVPRDTTAFYDDVHFNESGARIVADLVTRHLLDRILGSP